MNSPSQNTSTDIDMNASIPFASLLFLASFAHAAVTENFNQTLPLARNGEFSLENVNGNVDIIAWDKQEVSIEAEKTARNEEELSRLQIKVEATADRIKVETHHAKSMFGSNGGKVSYKVHVPAATRLASIEAVNSSLHIENVTGPMKLETVNGSIKATGLAASVNMETVNGSINAAFVTLPADAKVEMESVNGSNTLILPKNADATLKAETVNGRISLDMPTTSTSGGRKDLKATLGKGGASIKLETVNGSITVKSD